ncbi:MAG TPA: triose-phosphate isomerase [Dongiaceae bacterium]|jgi:triosephosphate isomerase|nr:triose-phosphate isomerase [Dongiaceae bacterium]
MEKIIIANWKMNGSRALIQAFAQALPGASLSARVVICPPFPYIAPLREAIPAIACGAQDCAAEEKGAFTGDVGASMLSELGCRYVILGHSERRAYHGESDALIHRKSLQALRHGLIPVICVGESLADREAARTVSVISDQVAACLPREGEFIVAYEPLWAIGTGRTATSAQIVETHTLIHSQLRQEIGRDLPVLYGGSVNAGNAKEIFQCPGVNGVLVGGASLTLEGFLPILANA